jgi:predicted Zn-dependent peptidase
MRRLILLALQLMLLPMAVLPVSGLYGDSISHRFFNGFTAVLTPQPGSGIVGMCLLIDGGSRFETDEERGTYRLILDMLLRGTKNRTPERIAAHIALLGGSFDTSTTSDYWAIEATVPSEKLTALLDLLSDLVFNPLFSSEELNKAKAVAAQTIESREDSPSAVMFDFYRSIFYPDFYASPDIRIRNIEGCTREDLLRIYGNYFSPRNMVLGLTGDIDSFGTTELVQGFFGERHAPDAAGVRPPVKQSPRGIPELNQKRGGITQAGIFVGTRLEGFDRRNSHLVEILNAVLDNSVGGRLFDEVRKQEGLVYDISAYYSVRIEPYTWFVFATTRRRNIQRVLSRTEEVLQALKRTPPTAEEIELAREYLKTRLAISYESPVHRARYEAERILRGEDIRSLEERFEHIDGVSTADIKEFIHHYFPDTWTKLVIR